MERRKKQGLQEWNKIIGEQEKSGLTAREYCRRRDIGVSSFYRWRQRLSEQDESFIDIGQFNTPEKIEPSDRKPLAVTLDFGDGFKLTIRRG